MLHKLVAFFEFVFYLDADEIREFIRGSRFILFVIVVVFLSAPICQRNSPLTIKTHYQRRPAVGE